MGTNVMCFELSYHYQLWQASISAHTKMTGLQFDLFSKQSTVGERAYLHVFAYFYERR